MPHGQRSTTSTSDTHAFAALFPGLVFTGISMAQFGKIPIVPKVPVVQFEVSIHRLRDERLIRSAHPGLKSWAGARDSIPITRKSRVAGAPRKRISRR